MLQRYACGLDKSKGLRILPMFGNKSSISMFAIGAILSRRLVHCKFELSEITLVQKKRIHGLTKQGTEFSNVARPVNARDSLVGDVAPRWKC